MQKKPKNKPNLFDNCLVPDFRFHKRLWSHDGALTFQWEEEQIILRSMVDSCHIIYSAVTKFVLPALGSLPHLEEMNKDDKV